MTELIYNGDYSKQKYFVSELTRIEHIKELVQNAKIILTARRGCFYPDKDFGSLIRSTALIEPREQYALLFSRQAIDRIDGVYVKSASIDGNNLILNLIINDEERQVSLELENNV